MPITQKTKSLIAPIESSTIIHHIFILNPAQLDRNQVFDFSHKLHPSSSFFFDPNVRSGIFVRDFL